MKILYIGSGFVGACSAAVSASSGHQTLVFDIDEAKIKALGSGDRDIIQHCLYEDGLGDLIVKNQNQLKFTSDYQQVEDFLNTCEAVFLCLPTPEIGETGESDLSFYFSATEKLAQSLVLRNQNKQEQYVVIVNKSTVPIDMVDRTEEIMVKAGVKNFGVVSNPEFLIEGKAIEGSLRPDRVVVGASSDKDFQIMREMYQRFYKSPSTQYLEVNPQEAAAGKLLANFTLFNKLAVCFDVLGRTCETFNNLHFENVRKILATDPRIGKWGMYDSLYAGGSCFIKDARSLSYQLQTAGENAVLVNETYLANKRQLEKFISRAKIEANFDWTDKTVTVLGLAFKRDTNDIRNSPSLEIINFLLEKSVGQIKLFDPAAQENLKKVFPESSKIKYFSNENEAIQETELIIIATDWPQFEELSNKLLDLSNRPLIMDGRRMLEHAVGVLQANSFDIIMVGSPFLKGKK
ncbi:MAG TPA: nucleotide sugar dehydrogenase [Candidatus Magasanikbacteria bacterium]|nr:nucleotide sugar dehydrogenase [Candidatus Magasanikbacteria bacterium]